MLRSIDFVGSHAPVRWSDWKSDFVPEGFTEINSVMGIRRSLRQRALIRYWLKLYDRIGRRFDQLLLCVNPLVGGKAPQSSDMGASAGI